MAVECSFSGKKAAGAWGLLFAFIWYGDWKCLKMKLYSHMCISRHAYWQQCIYLGLAYTSKISSRIIKIMLSGRTFALYSVLMSSTLINLTWSSLCTHTRILARWQNWEKRLLASSCPSVRPSVYPHGRIRLPLDGFWWNLLFEFFEKFVEKIQVLLKSDKIYGFFIRRHFHIYNNISQNSPWNEKRFRQKL
jgi:hypothetical protein